MPPLRERRSDIPALTTHLVTRLAQKHQRRIDSIPRQVFDALLAYDWPGNVRELENVLERAIIMTPDSTLRLLEPLMSEASDAVPAAPTSRLADVERTHILRVLHARAWRIEGVLLSGLNPVSSIYMDQPRVFVLDDDTRVVRAIARLFRSTGLAVQAFTSPASFLDHLPYDGPACLVLDMRMPGLSGLDVQEAMAALEATAMPTIFLSGASDVPSAATAMRKGAVDFLVKRSTTRRCSTP